MRTIKLNKKNILKGNLILVNKNYPYNTSKINTNEKLNLTYAMDSNIQLEKMAAKSLTKLIHDLQCAHKIVPVSGYRSLKEQRQIYTNSIMENGVDFTSKYVALPGHSEHQTGLAIDLGENSGTIDFIRPQFPYSGICGQFRYESMKYGFIERYPQGKEHITDIAHEPWHFRYVGYPHSEIMNSYDFTLEEYIEFIKNYTYKEEHYFYRLPYGKYEIFYIPSPLTQNGLILTSSSMSIELPEDVPYEISGNNVDGFICTLWRRFGLALKGKGA